MPNRNLASNEPIAANALLTEIRSKLEKLSNGDKELLFAFRRKVIKELGYDERGKPAHRNKLTGEMGIAEQKMRALWTGDAAQIF